MECKDCEMALDLICPRVGCPLGTSAKHLYKVEKREDGSWTEEAYERWVSPGGDWEWKKVEAHA